MRIRTQLIATLAAALALALGSVLAVVAAARDEAASGATQARAQATAHEVTGLLVLMQDYARHAEAGTAQQWQQRHAAVSATLAQELAGRRPTPALHELQAVTQALPPLFRQLQAIPADGSAFSARRGEVLMDQLLASTQAMSDHAYQWHQDATQQRADAELRFRVLAVSMPLAMLLLMTTLAGMIARRVLQPLQRLGAAAAAVSRGELGLRIASDAQDELGDVARQFDRMSVALAQARLAALGADGAARPLPLNLPTLANQVPAGRLPAAGPATELH